MRIANTAHVACFKVLLAFVTDRQARVRVLDAERLTKSRRSKGQNVLKKEEEGTSKCESRERVTNLPIGICTTSAHPATARRIPQDPPPKTTLGCLLDNDLPHVKSPAETSFAAREKEHLS